MVIIADSGSTKTTWKICDDSKMVTEISTPGLNPNFASHEYFVDNVRDKFSGIVGTNQPGEIYFYGSGVSDRTTAEAVTAALSEVFPGASVSVGSDLLGSVRALFGDEKGIACIIGTGSNSCLCDRGNIVRNIPPLGFILGDEGSGAYLGKMLLSDYLKGIMPELISESFRERYHTDKNDVISRVYRGEFPSRYVAGFVTFISENLESAYLYEMVLNGFRLFLQRNVLHYEGYPSLRIAFTGSVAWYFREILIKAMGEFNLSPGDIVKDPADRILEYHIKKKRG